jgi:hypothetical protein
LLLPLFLLFWFGWLWKDDDVEECGGGGGAREVVPKTHGKMATCVNATTPTTTSSSRWHRHHHPATAALALLVFRFLILGHPRGCGMVLLPNFIGIMDGSRLWLWL